MQPQQADHTYVECLMPLKAKPKQEWTKGTDGIKLDAQVWLDFLENYNGYSKFPPLVLPHPSEIDVFTDASLAG